LRRKSKPPGPRRWATNPSRPLPAGRRPRRTPADVRSTDPNRALGLRQSRGRWVERVLRPGEVYTTRLLPGLAFDPAPVFAAVEGG
jgi:hypothetical protein